MCPGKKFLKLLMKETESTSLPDSRLEIVEGSIRSKGGDFSLKNKISHFLEYTRKNAGFLPGILRKENFSLLECPQELRLLLILDKLESNAAFDSVC